MKLSKFYIKKIETNVPILIAATGKAGLCPFLMLIATIGSRKSYKSKMLLQPGIEPRFYMLGVRLSTTEPQSHHTFKVQLSLSIILQGASLIYVFKITH